MNEVQPIRTDAENAIMARFPAFAKTQAHWGGTETANARAAAFDVLKAKGLPSRRVEEWKYTDLRALLRELPPAAETVAKAEIDAAAKAKAAIDLKEATRILFVNGRNSAPIQGDGFGFYSLADGDTLPKAAADALKRERSYTANGAVALNTAFHTDVIVLHVPAKTKLAKPLHLIFRHEGKAALASYPRVLLVVEQGASATLVESHAGPAGVAYFVNALVQIDAGDEAEVQHIRHNDAGNASVNLSTLAVRTGHKTKFSSFAMTTGGAVSRHQMFFDLAGKDAQLSVQGATLLRGKQHADNTMVADHIKGGCVGRQLFKTVLDDNSRGVFQGLIIVRPDSQKTDGRMMSAALLLGDDAEMDNKPELEIFADDVQCGHGATVGALDESLLFYLRARGIPRKEAEALLIQSFVGEAIEHIEHEGVREALRNRAHAWLAERG